MKFKSMETFELPHMQSYNFSANLKIYSNKRLCLSNLNTQGKNKVEGREKSEKENAILFSKTESKSTWKSR